jgi:hypothetical protein
MCMYSNAGQRDQYLITVKPNKSRVEIPSGEASVLQKPKGSIGDLLAALDGAEPTAATTVDAAFASNVLVAQVERGRRLLKL